MAPKDTLRGQAERSLRKCKKLAAKPQVHFTMKNGQTIHGVVGSTREKDGVEYTNIAFPYPDFGNSLLVLSSDI